MTSGVHAVYRCVHDHRTRDKECSNVTRKDCVVGAIAYYNGDQTNLLEQFETFIYLGALLVSIIGSDVAWMMSAWRRALSQGQERLLWYAWMILLGPALLVAPGPVGVQPVDIPAT
jgi:hypothetical protein